MDSDYNQRLGSYVSTSFGGEIVRAFVPPRLPPDPPLRLDGLQSTLERANQSLGRLDGLAAVLPDPGQFLYAYVRKEAVLSSQIEGTQSSLSDLLLFEGDETPGVPIHDVQEVSNYVAALDHGLRRLGDGFPLSLRLIREIHGVLLSKGRGAEKSPGEFRTSQNWIGGSRPGNAIFVPPPPATMMDCLHQFENFLHEERRDLPLLIKAGLAHVQFETIHPFLDGNGRLGRLLITFLLCSAGVLRAPLLYMSLYLKARRETYYDLLMRVRETGDWESWLEFFLSGVQETSDQAIETARRILALGNEDRQRVERLGRAAASALLVYQHAQSRPVFSIGGVAEKTGLTFPTVAAAAERLQRLGIIAQFRGGRRGRIFVYRRYLDILDEGTEPLR